MSTVKKRCPDRSSYLRQSSDELRAPMCRRERGARADNETVGGGGGGGDSKAGRGGGKDAAEIPVSYDKRDNGLSNYPVERLNRATMKFVLSASFFSFS